MGDDEAGDDDDDDDDEGSDGSSGGGVEDNLDFFDWLEEFTEKMEKVAKIIMKYVPLVCLLLQFCSHSRLTRLYVAAACSFYQARRLCIHAPDRNRATDSAPLILVGRRYTLLTRHLRLRFTSPNQSVTKRFRVPDHNS